MKVELTGEKNTLLRKEFIVQSVQFIQRALEKRHCSFPSNNPLLVIAFVSEESMKKFNHQFRGKDQVTDVLSFSPVEEGGLGELALCIPQVEIQARSHKLTVEEETFYLILHGILHLLGYNHEGGGARAKEMYQVQDEIFEEWKDQKEAQG